MTPVDLPLQGVQIWYTRPLGVEGDLVRRCTTLGAEVWRAPVLAIVPLAEGDPALAAARRTLDDLEQYQHIVFISGNAVLHGMALLQSCWPSRVRCYAIGAATARLLAQRGVEALQPPGTQMNTEGLLQVAELRQLSGERVLIVRGVGGRELLARALEDRGARVDYLETYRRTKSVTLNVGLKSRIAENSFNFITASSGETVENIINLVDDRLRDRLLQIALVVPGERVAAVARRLGFNHIVSSANAGDQAMVDAILEATSTRAGAVNNTK